MRGRRAGRQAALAIALTLAACGRVYSGSLVLVGGEDRGLLARDVRIASVAADSADVIVSLLGEPEERLVGCFEDSPPGSLPLTEVSTPRGRRAFVLRISRDSVPGLAGRGFVPVPEAVLREMEAGPDSALLQRLAEERELVREGVHDPELVRRIVPDSALARRMVEDSILARRIFQDPVLARQMVEASVSTTCRQLLEAADREALSYEMSVTSERAGRLVAAGVGVLAFVLLLTAGGGP